MPDEEGNRIRLNNSDWTPKEAVYLLSSLAFGFAVLTLLLAIVFRVFYIGSDLSDTEIIGLAADVPALIACFFIVPKRVIDMRRTRKSIESDLANTFPTLAKHLRKDSVTVPRYFRDGGPLWIDYEKKRVFRNFEDTHLYNAVKETPLTILMAEAGKGKTTLASLTGIDALREGVFIEVYYERAAFSTDIPTAGLYSTVGSRLAYISKLMDDHPTYRKKRALVILDDIHLLSKRQLESIGSNLNLFEDRVAVLMISRPRTPFVDEEIKEYANMILQNSAFTDKIRGPYQGDYAGKDADVVLQVIERGVSHRTVERIVRWYTSQLDLKGRIGKNFYRSIAEAADGNLTLLSLLLRRIDTDGANLASDLDICQAAEDYLNDLRNRCVAAIVDKEKSFLQDEVLSTFNKIMEVLFTFSKMEVYLPQTNLLSFSEINSSERPIAGHIVNYLKDCGELREATLGNRRFNLFSNPTIAAKVSFCKQQKAIANGASDEAFIESIDEMTVTLLKSLAGNEAIGPLYNILSYCHKNGILLPGLVEFLESDGAVMVIDLVKSWHRSYKFITPLEKLVSSNNILHMICQRLSDEDGWLLLKAVADSNELLKSKEIQNAIKSSASAIAQSIETSDNPKEIIHTIRRFDKLRNNLYIIKAVSHAVGNDVSPFDIIGEIGWIYDWTRFEELERSIIEMAPRIAEEIRNSSTPWGILSNLHNLPIVQRHIEIRKAVRETTTKFLAGMMRAPTDLIYVLTSPPPLPKPNQKLMNEVKEIYALWEFLGPISHYPELNGNPDVIESMVKYIHASKAPWEAITMIWEIPCFWTNPTIRESIINVAERTAKAIACSSNPWEILDDVAQIPELKSNILKTGVLERVTSNIPSSITEIDDIDEFFRAVSSYSEILKHPKTRHLISKAMPIIIDIIKKDAHGLKSPLLEIKQVRESHDVIRSLAQAIDDAEDIVNQLHRIGSYPSLLDEKVIQDSIQRNMPRLLNSIPLTRGWMIGGIAYIAKLDTSNSFLKALSNAIEESETPWYPLDSVAKASHLITEKLVQEAIRKAKPKILDALGVSSEPWEIMWLLRAVPQIVESSDVRKLLAKRKNLFLHSVIRHPEPLGIVWCLSLISDSSNDLEILKACNDEFVLARCLEEFILIDSELQTDLFSSLKNVFSDSHLSKFSEIRLDRQGP